MCGKNKLLISGRTKTAGSPPRVREKLAENQWFRLVYGITPACAGKTNIVFKTKFEWKDHPRVCGKNGRSIPSVNRLTGSPPRVREKLIHFVYATTTRGITPACAGKTVRKKLLAMKSRDHPRVCGKNDFGVPQNRERVGSPPRVREKH